MHMRRAGSALAVVLLVLGACTGDGDGTREPVATDDGGDPGDDASEDATDPAPVVEEPVGPNGRLQLSGFVERNRISVNLQLSAVEVDPNGDLLLDIEAVNRGFRGVNATSLAQSSVRVRDDVGTDYEFVRPVDNDQLRFTADERLTGTLVFRGPIDPEASYLEVGFNQRGDQAVLAADDPPSQYPKFLFPEVPLPGIGLEAKAGDGGGGSLTEASTVTVGLSAESERRAGFVVDVVEYVEDGQTVTFTVEAVNGSERMASLTGGFPSLDDGQDSNFVYVRPADVGPRTPEARVDLEPGEEATVQIAFRGVISGEADELTLRFDDVTFTGIPIPDVDT